MGNFYKDNAALRKVLEHPLMRRIVDLKENGYAQSGEYDTAPSDFEDALDSYDKVLEVLGEICADTIASNAAGVDREGPKCTDGRVSYASGTQQNHDLLTRAGLYGLSLPRRYNGLNFPTVAYVMASELVSRADAGFVNIWALQNCADTINDFADEDLKEFFLPRIAQGATCSMDLTEPDAGSDLQSAMLRAQWNEERGEWLLNGVKRFITNGDADIKLVLARSERGTTDARGLSYFVYDKRWGGVTVRRIEHKLGIIGSPTCELVFDNAPAKLIGNRKMGLIKYVMALMNSARLGIGAQAVGISEAAYREALKYAHERKQYGKLIVEFPAVFEMLAGMRSRIDASRALLYETSRMVDLSKVYADLGRDLTSDERAEMKSSAKVADMLTPILKLMSGEYSNQITYDAIQIFGGSGYVKENAVERLYRDARVTTIYEGTSQLQVVAAVKYVSNGVLLARIREYEAAAQKLVGFENEKARLKKLTDEFEAVCGEIAGHNGQWLDYHARRMVECGGGIVMAYLLLLEAEDNERIKESLRLYLSMTESENAKNLCMIDSVGEEEIALRCEMFV